MQIDQSVAKVSRNSRESEPKVPEFPLVDAEKWEKSMKIVLKVERNF